MANDAKEEQKSCKTCSIVPPNQAEVLNGEILKDDQQNLQLRYLSQGVLPTNQLKREKLKRYVTRFKVVQGKLFKRSFQGMWMVCIPTKEANGVLSDLYEGKPTGHPGGRRLWQMVVHQGYYQPTIQRDAQDFAKKCQECQRQGDETHTNHQSLHPIVAPYPFHSWGLDFIGPINPPSERCTWILVATELFTKWVEAVVMKKATGSSVANFLKENIVCHFGVPSKIIQTMAHHS